MKSITLRPDEVLDFKVAMERDREPTVAAQRPRYVEQFCYETLARHGISGHPKSVIVTPPMDGLTPRYELVYE